MWPEILACITPALQMQFCLVCPSLDPASPPMTMMNSGRNHSIRARHATTLPRQRGQIVDYCNIYSTYSLWLLHVHTEALTFLNVFLGPRKLDDVVALSLPQSGCACPVLIPPMGILPQTNGPLKPIS